MQTATLVHQTSEKVVISQLAEGDVYKRLIPKTAYEVEKIVMGVVTDILHNGETAVVQATEFEADTYSVTPKMRVFGPDTDLILFPAKPEDIEQHYAEVRKYAETQVKDAQKTLRQREDVVLHLATIVERLVSKGLAAAKAVAYIEPEATEIDGEHVDQDDTADFDD